MRIGLVTGEYPPMQGGVGAYSRILANELTQQGQVVSILSSIKAQVVDPGVHLTNTIRRWNAGSLLTISRWAKERQLDVINLQFQTAAYDMSPWIHFLPAWIHGVPVVTTFHDLRYPYLFPKAGWLRDRIVLHLARASSGAIVTNHEDAARLKGLSSVSLIPIGSNILKTPPMDFDEQQWRLKIGAQTSDFLIAYFGLINHSKGLETLFTGLKQLRDQNIPARLVMIGGGAGSSDPTNVAFVEQLKALMTRLELTPHVYQTGFVDEETVAAYLSASDVVALPFLDGASYRRGSLMAAIRYGCAIVTTQPRVNIPNFKHGDNMLLVSPGDSEALAESLRQLYADPAQRRRLRQGAAQLAGCFEWSRIARDTIQVFNTVIEMRA